VEVAEVEVEHRQARRAVLCSIIMVGFLEALPSFITVRLLLFATPPVRQ